MPALACPICETTYPAGPDEPWQCPNGHPLELTSRPTPTTDTPPTDDHDENGLWTFADLLPTTSRVTLGEGWTPLVQAPNWGISFKLEYVSPTGSFKDRGATVTISRAKDLGVDRVIEDSSGNAGAAIAMYAARAGIDAQIFVPADTPSNKRRRIEATGADVVPVEGPRSAAASACHDAVEAGAGWYASHAWRPTFYAGTATFAYELAAQRGWVAPDAVVLPIGHGTLFLGAFRGFQAMAAHDWIDTMPRLLGVQAAGTAPVVTAVRDEKAATGKNAVAGGVQIERPARFDQVCDAVAASDGDAIAVTGSETTAAQQALGETGFSVEPTAALAPAGVDTYREEGIITSDDDVVVPLTGALTNT